MPKTVVLTGTGRDQVGIVAKLTQALYELGCNLLDSSMTLLRGQFAIIVMVELPKGETMAALETRLSSVGKDLGLTIHLRELDAEELQHKEAPSHVHIVSVYGADKPGIVAGITRVLADLSVNITDVQTSSTKADGGDVYVMILEAALPATLASQQFSAQLTEEGRRLGVDITVQQIDIMEL